MAIQGRRESVFYDKTPEGKIIGEAEGFTCGHCQHVTQVPPGHKLDDLGVFCLACCRPCCKVCSWKMAHLPADQGGMCDVFEKKLLRIEASAAARRSYEECSR